MNGLLFTSYCESQRLSRSWQLGEAKWALFCLYILNVHMLMVAQMELWLKQKINFCLCDVCLQRVEDNDGEFLLIEAADHLPKWLNPDSSENRVGLHPKQELLGYCFILHKVFIICFIFWQVFLYRGQLHILPYPSKLSPVGFSKDVAPSVSQALAVLSSHPHVCQASPKICSALKKRLNG